MMEGFCEETSKVINEIKQEITASKVQENERFELKRCIPEKLPTFTGREREVHDTISFLKDENCGIVSIVGGPGFGKSTIAVEVSHCSCENYGMPVIFSYLSNVLTKDELIRRLCHDVGVNPGEDSESSLLLWLRNVKQDVILVMDNIEQLLEGEMRTEFTDLVKTLRKNTNQRLKILTTSRSYFEIGDLKVKNVEVREMDHDSSVELLEKFCEKDQIDEESLAKLAKLCGHVPLALCITASRILDTDKPQDLLKWLAEKPMEVLKTSECELYVQKAIGMSFGMLNDKDQKAFVRLGVFNGNFDKSAAEEVLGRSEWATQDLLKKLTNRSLIRRDGQRYHIHLLVRQFLVDRDQLQDEWSTAQKLMVQYFLKVCQSLTEKYYSKDGCNGARKSLAKDAHNVEEVIKICGSEVRNSKPGIVESLETSCIYQSSSRFFYNFIRNVLPSSAVRIFLETCVELAKKRGHLAIEINFQCLLADEEGHKSDWKSDEYNKKMEETKQKFYRNENLLQKDDGLVSHFNYSYGRYLSLKKATPSCSKSDLLREAVCVLHKSWCLRKDKATSQSFLEKPDEAITLIQLGRLNKERAWIEHESNPVKYKRSMKVANDLFQRALSLTKTLLGDHELTRACYKCLGDLFRDWQNNEAALKYYEEAKNMSKRLGLYSNYSVVSLLKNYGLCLFYLSRYEESVKQLEEAREIVDIMLAESDSRCRTRATVYLHLAQAFDCCKNKRQEAVKYVKAAISMKEFLRKNEIQKLKKFKI